MIAQLYSRKFAGLGSGAERRIAARRTRLVNCDAFRFIADKSIEASCDCHHRKGAQPTHPRRNYGQDRSGSGTSCSRITATGPSGVPVRNVVLAGSSTRIDSFTASSKSFSFFGLPARPLIRRFIVFATFNSSRPISRIASASMKRGRGFLGFFDFFALRDLPALDSAFLENFMEWVAGHALRRAGPGPQASVFPLARTCPTWVK
jgi:hypothetical protein